MRYPPNGPIAVLLTLLALGCRSATGRMDVLPFYKNLAFDSFAEEALFGHGTARTHAFDDYTDGSYHVDPRELAEKLPGVAARYGRDQDAVVVIGPYGPLWTFDVITVLREPGCLRVNLVVMPHARITIKRSGCAPQDAVTRSLEKLAEVAALPSEAVGGSCLMLARGVDVRWSTFDCFPKGDSSMFSKMEESTRTLVAELPLTYSGYPPEKKP